MREAQYQRELAEAKAEQERRIAARVEELRIRKEKEAAILNADRATVRELVSECRSRIRTKLSEGSPYEVYFPHYSPVDLKKLGDMSVAFGMPLGRPSVGLDDYGFDPVDWNVKRIMHKDYPIHSISFVVEHPRGAGTYDCRLDGLKITEPREGVFYRY